MSALRTDLRVLVLDLEVAHEVARDVGERLLGPRQEPVDGAAVDERGELLRARAELVADGREAEDEVQVGAHAVDEEGPQLVLRRVLAPWRRATWRTRRRLAVDGVDLVAREEVGQLARVEEDVDVLEEALLLDLLVGEDEGDALALEHARLQVERLEVLEQVDRRVRLVMVIWKKVAPATCTPRAA